MGALWLTVGLLAAAVIIGGAVLATILTSSRRKEIRSQKFKRAMLEQETKRDAALLKDPNSPEAYIASKNMIAIKERYLAGEDEPL